MIEREDTPEEIAEWEAITQALMPWQMEAMAALLEADDIEV